ncbi:sugar transferase [Curtobacterium ammoniigenes]|uniref:sugar transferase n=1 Tax=Curtobacterium ammoniigenes TaxID=395387 RepID=UPI0008366ACB|nr:sugar transferase [Curtobacterium ammoniigenes]
MIDVAASTPTRPRSVRSDRGDGGILFAVSATEALALLAGTFASMLIRFGLGPNGVDLGFVDMGYAAFSVLLSACWFGLIQLLRADRAIVRHLGEGSGYTDITTSTIVTALAVAVYSAITQTEISRGYLLAAIPLSAVLLAGTRGFWRRWLRRRRRQGTHCERAVLAGPEERLPAVEALIAADPDAGMRVGERVSVVGDADDHARIVRAVAATGASIVVVAGAPHDDTGIRSLMWALEPLGARVLVVPHLGPIAMRRVRTVPVSDSPLIVVEPARFSGRRYVSKRAFDILASTVALVVLAPLLLVLAAIIRLDSPGPALYRQRRIGRNGAAFTMLKFRSMRVDADAHRAALLLENDHRGGPMFKMRADPRVTRVGRILRRTSLDELPQLINVFAGQMSLVGPRPPLPEEVAAYADHARRRLLTKPGITGPWQIGGRSDLGWEEGLLLDVLYVENWSVAGDLGILLRTVKAVVDGRGAY